MSRIPTTGFMYVCRRCRHTESIAVRNTARRCVHVCTSCKLRVSISRRKLDRSPFYEDVFGAEVDAPQASNPEASEIVE